MRQVIVPVLMMIFLLSGCGEDARLQKEFDEARDKLLAAESVSFTADVTAELADSVFDCTLVCSKAGEETVVELIKPENIAGIKARISEGQTEIEYDSLILALGDPLKGEISPLSAMPMLMDALLEGHAVRLWTERANEREMVVAQVYISENDYAKLWFERENYAFVHAELVSGGRAVVKCEITSTKD